jgi:hypothetical protein
MDRFHRDAFCNIFLFSHELIVIIVLILRKALFFEYIPPLDYQSFNFLFGVLKSLA